MKTRVITSAVGLVVLFAVMALFYGVGHWNSYFNEMIFLSTRSKFPLQVILREIIIITQMTSSGTVTNMEAQTQAQMQQLFRHDRIDAADHPRVPVFAAVFCEGRHDRFDQGVSKARPFRK